MPRVLTAKRVRDVSPSSSLRSSSPSPSPTSKRRRTSTESSGDPADKENIPPDISTLSIRQTRARRYELSSPASRDTSSMRLSSVHPPFSFSCQASRPTRSARAACGMRKLVHPSLKLTPPCRLPQPRRRTLRAPCMRRHEAFSVPLSLEMSLGGIQNGQLWSHFWSLFADPLLVAQVSQPPSISRAVPAQERQLCSKKFYNASPPDLEYCEQFLLTVWEWHRSIFPP